MNNWPHIEHIDSLTSASASSVVKVIWHTLSDVNETVDATGTLKFVVCGLFATYIYTTLCQTDATLRIVKKSASLKLS